MYVHNGIHLMLHACGFIYVNGMCAALVMYV